MHAHSPHQHTRKHTCASSLTCLEAYTAEFPPASLVFGILVLSEICVIGSGYYLVTFVYNHWSCTQRVGHLFIFVNLSFLISFDSQWYLSSWFKLFTFCHWLKAPFFFFLQNIYLSPDSFRYLCRSYLLSGTFHPTPPTIYVALFLLNSYYITHLLLLTYLLFVLSC